MASNKPCQANTLPLLANRVCRTLAVFGLFLGVLPLTAPAQADPIQAEYFTDSRYYPMNGDSQEAVVTQYDLAAPVLLEKNISLGLPADPTQAEAMAKAWFKDNQAKISEQLQAAYASHTKALNYALKKYPAWVFDGRAIVYGVTDLREGLALYRAWRSKSGASTQTGGGGAP